jgi:hypothetical protein
MQPQPRVHGKEARHYCALIHSGQRPEWDEMAAPPGPARASATTTLYSALSFPASLHVRLP